MLKQHSPQVPLHRQNTYAPEHNLLAFGEHDATRTVPMRSISRTDSRDHDANINIVPQHYAQPVPRSLADMYTDSYTGSSHHESRQTEHMLRRKTPNGVLHAAYDGTSVEQTERPHATKHIILPASEHFMQGRDPVAGNSFHVQENHLPGFPAPGLPYMPHALEPYRSPNPADMWRGAMPYGPNPPAQWNAVRAQHQIDSILSQYPMQAPQPFAYYHYSHPGYGFMPQPLQPSFIPTAANTPGPYGPYWPNGQFQPYYPAATRDLRFQPSYATGWLAPPGNFNPHGHVPPMVHGLNLPQPFPNTLQLSNNPMQPFIPNQHGHRPHNAFQGALLRHHALNAAASRNAPAETPRFVPNLSRITATTPSTRSSSAPQSSTTEESAINQSPTASLSKHRDHMFKQAVAIYVELVKHLHKSRINASNNSRHGSSNSSSRVYPRPPRPSSQDYATRPTPIRHDNTGSHTSQRSEPFDQQHHQSGANEGVKADSFSPERSSHIRQQHAQDPMQHSVLGSPASDRIGHLRRESDQSLPGTSLIPRQDHYPVQNAVSALEWLTTACHESDWQWVDGLLLGGSLAYALADYSKAHEWYSKILLNDSRHVEAMSNLAATLMAMSRKREAEQHWQRAIKLRPSYFEAVEHLIGLLCNESRNQDAIGVIDYVEKSLRCKRKESADPTKRDLSPCPSELSDKPIFEYEGEQDMTQERKELPGADQPGFASSGYNIPGTDNGRIHTLVHARGNLLYAAGDTIGAAKAFEEAVLITVGRHFGNVDGLVKHILDCLCREVGLLHSRTGDEPLLIPPSFALETLKFCFPPNGSLPGLRDLPSGAPGIKAALSTTSNSLLSLAKIFQDGMASSSPKQMPFATSFGVREILALYYLSLALQQSPSTANNVGILLAGLQQTVTPKMLAILQQESLPTIPGVSPGSGVHMALAYYNYGLNLDRRHAHLYTNLGSLLKDLGQLQTAIRMYEEAVKCDPKFDIALANLANAVKDQGRIADAITYYQRAVDASPDFAEALCGLANALNSVCGWQGRGGIAADNGRRDRWHVDANGLLKDATQPGATSSGWIKRVVDLVGKQLAGGEQWGQGSITSTFVQQVQKYLQVTSKSNAVYQKRLTAITAALNSWAGQNWEGQRVLRLVERAMRCLTWQWYQDLYVTPNTRPDEAYGRPLLPVTIPTPAAPTVLPFHTFTSPMSATQIRQISQRNGLRISCSTQRALWMSPLAHKPPAPPEPYLKVGYVSSDFNNHPLAHLMQSVFGLHDTSKVLAHCYATTASDNSAHRQQIERESPVFYDASTWAPDKLVKKILDDGIHILVNLNGYTRGARNEVFAARAAPIQMSFMGFAGTLGAEWCDYLLADETAVPKDTLRPWRGNVDIEDQIKDEELSNESDDWIYAENIIYCRDTFFCCDHRQSAPDSKDERICWDEEQATRWKMRKDLFPDLPDDAIILGNFNQLYKIEPTTFRTWLRILDRVPKAVLWLLRFPDLGEQYLKKTALAWAGSAVANRVIFTDVAPKLQHISRARICDLFLDTPECNAHTTAADILWSGTPLLTLPRYKYKMCSRMAASILKGALPRGDEGRRAADELIAVDEEDYEHKAVRLVQDLDYSGRQSRGRLLELRQMLWRGRWTSPLFDTKRWVRDLEEAYSIAWERWVKGEGGDIWL